jgi:hypothetical protein
MIVIQIQLYPYPENKQINISSRGMIPEHTVISETVQFK